MGNLYFEDIVHAFREGVRNTDDFSINVKTYYKWIKAHRNLIWAQNSNQSVYVDKRLHYRKRQGTGMKRLSNEVKQLNNKKIKDNE